MKKILIAVLLALVSNYTLAAEGAYISGNFGVAIPTEKDEVYIYPAGENVFQESRTGVSEGFAFGAAIGYEFESNIRLEGEVAYQKNDAFESVKYSMVGVGVVESFSNSVPLHTMTVMANTYYAFNNSSNFVPYVGGGIGYGRMFTDYIGFDAFAYQGTAGLDYFLTEKFSLGVKYRFNGLVNDQLSTDAKSHNIYAGARVYF